MPKEIANMELETEDYSHHFNEYRSLLNDWRCVGVEAEEIASILSICNKLEEETSQFKADFMRELSTLEHINEVSLHHKDQLGFIGGGTASSFKYQE